MPVYENSLLCALGAEVLGRLALQPVVYKLRQDIEVPGTAIRHLHFVEEGMASMTTSFRDGSQVEVGMFGRESVIGISALMGTLHSLNRVFTQIAGRGYRCGMKEAVTEFQRGEAFQHLTLRYVQAQLLQTMQSAGCNAKHEVEQRLARWLLLCADRTNSRTFLMPQEFLAEMIGTRRTTVTIAALHLKEAGLIEYSRGHMVILDEKGLEARACECYRVIIDHLHSATEFDNRTVA